MSSMPPSRNLPELVAFSEREAAAGDAAQQAVLARGTLNLRAAASSKAARDERV
jgi:hypothetical protein